MWWKHAKKDENQENTDLEKAIEFLNRFLELCEEAQDKTKAGEAHK